MRRRDLQALVAVLLLPALAAAIGLWSMSGRADTFDQVPAAVVNLDEGTTMEVDGKMQEVPLGRMLAGALTDPETADIEGAQRSLDWKLATKKDGMDGLKDGSYKVVIEIPKDFSDNLASAGKPDAKKAMIYVRSNQAANYVTSLLSDEIARAAANALGQNMTEEMLSQIYVSMVDLKGGVSEAARGAGDLSQGAADINTGADQLNSGIGRLQGGSGQATSGAQQLASALNLLSGGAQQLSGGVGQLSTAASQLGQGNAQLAAGLVALDQGVVGDGTTLGLLQGLQMVNRAINVGNPNTNPPQPSMKDAAAQLAEGSRELADALAPIAVGVEQIEPLVDQLQQLSGQLDKLPDTATALAAVDQFVAQCPTSLPACQLLRQNVGTIKGYILVLDKLAGPNGENIKQLITSITGDGTPENPGLLNGLKQLSYGSEQLAEGMEQLKEGIDSSDPNNPGLAQAMPPLVNGAEELHYGLVGKKDAHGRWIQPGLIPAANQLTAGQRQLTGGINQLGQGAQQLASGTNQAHNGANQLAGGLGQLDAGIGQLYVGSGQLADGTQQLHQGSTTLADGLQDAAGQIPAYSDSQSQHIANIGAHPVGVESSVDNKGATDSTSAFPLTAALMLWLGSFATFLIMPSLRRSALNSSDSAPVVWVKSWWPAVAIGAVHALLVIGVGFLFDIQPDSFITALFFMLFVAIVFATIIQMMMAAFGQRLGSIFTLLFFVIQGASLSGILPIETAPAFFGGLNKALPLSLANDGLARFILGGHAADIVAITAGLLAWFIASAFIIIALVPSKRRNRFAASQEERAYLPSPIG